MQISLRHTDDTRERTEAARALCFAIGGCHPDDARQILCAAIDDLSAGDPPCLDPFGNLRADAEFWADCAHPRELEAYFSSALKRLGNRALGITARKRLFVIVWQSLPLADRKAFLARVDAQGQFIEGGAR
jgi:hypothetical protein